MEDICIYDFEFQLLYIASDLISSNWTICYNGVGSFEGVFAAEGELMAVVSQPYLILAQGDKQAIITGWQLEGNTIKIYGKTVNWLLSRNVTLPFKTSEFGIAEDVQSIARYLAAQAFDGALTLGKEAEGFEKTAHFWRNTANDTLQVIIDCLDNDGGGHVLRFDILQQKWVFEVFRGRVLDAEVSADDGTAYDVSYVNDCQDYCGGGWWELRFADAGEWNPATNTPALMDGAEGNYLKSWRVTETGTWQGKSFTKDEYAICTAKDGLIIPAKETSGHWVKIPAQESGIKAWYAVLSGENESEVQTALQKKKWEKSISAKVKELELLPGDSVRVRVVCGSWDFVQTKRVEKINYWYENNNSGMEPVLEEAE